MIFLILILIIFLIPLSFFIFPQLSPIPYFPTNKKDLALIIKSLNLKNNHSVVDLGAGDGALIFAAAQEAYQKKLTSQFIAVEINPILILILYLGRLFHPNKKNIKIIWGNMFKLNYKKLITDNRPLITIYLYISPWFLEKVINNLIPQLTEKNFSVISYRYKIPGWEKKLIKTVTGENKIFVYQFSSSPLFR